MPDIWTFHSATSLVFGSGSIAQLGPRVVERKIGRALIVTDQRLASAGIVDTVRDSLARAGVAVDVFDGGAPEPSLDLADAVVERARRDPPDALVGLGGGSNMDLAKAAAILLTHGGTLRERLGENQVPGPVLPIVCVPTTAGTGSEVTASAVLTDTGAQLKVGILSNFLRPLLAVVDPLLTRSCPPKVTADSGIDALVHAIEAYTAVDNSEYPSAPGERSCYQGRNPLAGSIAELCVSLVGQHLRRAVHEPECVTAREGMALAATLGGMAFSNVGVALVHAMEYPLGGQLHVSHGAGNGLLLPHVMRYNLPGRETAMARIGELLDEDHPTSPGVPLNSPLAEPDARGAAERAIELVVRLSESIGIPQTLRSIGAREDQLRPFAEKAFSIKRILRVNPRPVTLEAIEAIYRAAF